MRRILLALVLAMAVSHAACGADNITTGAPQVETSSKRDESMKIRITSGEKVITATMHDNATARDFISLLH